jgi:uncharacterized protein (DUF433 family)
VRKTRRRYDIAPQPVSRIRSASSSFASALRLFLILRQDHGLHVGHWVIAQVILKAVNLMSALREVENLLPSLTRAEKAQLLRAVVQDLDDAFPGVESPPGVCGGEPCIVRTRIPVWVLEQARRLGATEENLLRSYRALRAEDLASACAYVRSHRSEIEEQIRDNENA